MKPKTRLMRVYRSLSSHYGEQDWWPGDTREEIIIGAVLTQNTAWSNVEKAINNLKQAGLLDIRLIRDMPQVKLAELIRPSGYFNIKARRLQALCAWLVSQGGVKALAQWPTDELRSALLDVHGVGPETADDILLYAFNRAVFVIDAYTRRLFSRLGISDEQDYETLRVFCQSNLQLDERLFNEYHALIVIHAKEVCLKRPRCDQCILQKECEYISEY